MDRLKINTVLSSRAAASADPREQVDLSPMSTPQIVAVAAAIGINALDGFDVLAISFAAPGIASSWGLQPTALGFVLSMELVGMAIGSVFLGNAADRVGRRTMALICLALMAAGMALTAVSRDILELSLCRVATGIGIGGVLPALTALVAEHSNARHRAMCMSLMVVGYSAGAVLGGSLAAPLLADGAWRNVFSLGAAMTAVFIPVAWFAIPETAHFLLARGRSDAREQVNELLLKFRMLPVATLPIKREQQERASPQALFARPLLPTTLLAIALYFGHILTFYFVMKWAVKLLVDAGHTPSHAAWLLVLVNLAGITGGVLFGLAARRIELRYLSAGIFVCSALSVISFGLVLGSDSLLVPAMLATGVFINGGVVACYSIIARVFPPHVRATGSGVVLGLGRLAAVLAPILAGSLLGAGFSAAIVAALLACGSVCALVPLIALKFGDVGQAGTTSH